MAITVVPASGGAAVLVGKGQRIRVTTPKGAQAADFLPIIRSALMNGFHRCIPGCRAGPSNPEMATHCFRVTVAQC